MFKKIKHTIKLAISLIIIALSVGLFISIMFPIGYKDIINKYSDEYNVDPFLISAIINVESKFNKDAVSHKNAKGLMQVGPQTGQWAADTLNVQNYNDSLLFEPEINIRFGTWYINQLKNEFNNNMGLVITAYNAGSGNVNRWLKDSRYSSDNETLNKIPFKETEEYLKKVKNNYKIYKIIYRSYMEKPDSFNPIYIDVIIVLRKLLKNFLNYFR